MEEQSDWFSPDASTFGDRLAGAREQAGLTQAELARRLGVRLATLQKWEDDHTEPRANRLSMLAGLLNVSIMWLINGEGEGLEMPEEGVQPSDDMRALMTEMRALRTSLLQDAEKLGRLEKRLRLMMTAPADV